MNIKTPSQLEMSVPFSGTLIITQESVQLLFANYRANNSPRPIQSQHGDKPDPATEIFMWKGVPVREMSAYPLTVACKLLGISRTTLWRQIALGHLRKTPRNLIPRFELERYLKDRLGAPE
jgi:hypothetical protein